MIGVEYEVRYGLTACATATGKSEGETKRAHWLSHTAVLGTGIIVADGLSRAIDEGRVFHSDLKGYKRALSPSAQISIDVTI